MALSFGWRANEVRESIWRDDPALVGVTEAALQEWYVDFDASHLRPFAKLGQPTIIELRTLTSDEAQAVLGFFHDAANREEAWSRACLLAFRIGASFPGLEGVPTGDGQRHGVTVKERGIRMLAEPFVSQLSKDYRGIVITYGGHILNASILTDAEKKASSPPSTQTQSSEAASTAATTETSPIKKVA